MTTPQNRTALVTGASRGIGRATAAALAEAEAAHVLVQTGEYPFSSRCNALSERAATCPHRRAASSKSKLSLKRVQSIYAGVYMMSNQPLFTPYRMGDLDLPIRIVMAPVTRMRAQSRDHVATALQAEYYAQRASAGLIITEATAISPEGFVR
jgi:NAD(P)-dependent dehydrogenase (short-subunit alcohol dehydrogenase family)